MATHEHDDCCPSKYEEVRADAMKKGHLTRVDLFRMYRAFVQDVDQLETDLAHVSENRPDVNINPDVSLERAHVAEVKRKLPQGYERWLAEEDEGEKTGKSRGRRRERGREIRQRRTRDRARKLGRAMQARGADGIGGCDD